MRVLLFAVVVLGLASVAAAVIPAWCSDPAQVKAKAAGGAGRCAFYTECLEALYNCKADPNAENRYPIDYGDKYCKKFSAVAFKSDKGKLWRDKTLECLQLALVPFIKGKTTCADLTNKAFDSHPRCYTQPGASICELARPANDGGGVTGRAQDAATISTTVDSSDLLTKRSAKQIADVIGKCAGQILDYAGKKAGEALDAGVEKAKEVGNGIKDGATRAYNWVTGRGNFLQIRAQLRALKQQSLAPEHARRVAQLEARVEQLSELASQ